MKAVSNIDAWRVLAAIAEGNGITGASESTGIDLPACTRLIKKLEEELGYALVEHQVRPARLTDFGLSVLPAAREIAAEQSRILSAAASFTRTPLVIRLSVPVNNPRKSVNEHIRTYREFDPSLSVQVISDMDHQDVLEGRADLAYIPYDPPASGLVILPIGRAMNVPVVSPGYLETHPFPHTPEDLIHHKVILRESRHYPVTDHLEKNSENRPLRCAGIAFSGDVLSGRECVLNGEGVALDLSFSRCLTEIKEGKLIPVLDGWHRPEWHLNIVIAKENESNARLMKFARWFASAEAFALNKRSEKRESMMKNLFRA